MAVLVNGVNYSWANLTNIAFGVPVVGIKAISYSRKQVTENNYGFGQEPTSIGYGNITYEGKITVYKDWWQSVINAAPNKDPFQIAPFDWTIAFANFQTGAQVPVITETLRNVRFMEDNLNANQGDTALMIDIPFIWAGKITN
jgi:hypothetical protein